MKPSPTWVNLTEDWICSSCRQQRGMCTGSSFSGRAARLHNSILSKTKRILGRTHQSQHSTIRSFTSHGRKNADAPATRNGRLPTDPARTRFAPSPTGHMHIGGLRTALFSFLLAKRTNGQFILRIEDTDQKRFVPGAEERLCEDLQWAGIEWDEGPLIGGPYGPYKQSERTSIYAEHAQTLLDAGSAYRCFCTPQTTGADGSKAAYVTSGCYQACSSLSHDESHERASKPHNHFTVRLKQPANVHKRVYTDLIYGKIQRLKRSPSAALSGEDDSGIDAADTILIKSDGTPTYHFANVVDDHLMEITHVLRGSEWMASTPLHYDLYTAFDWRPPVFAHVGLLVDENRAKLSKRSDTGLVLDARGMRQQNGILPEALCNFLALLGWSNPGRNDVLELQELIRDFDLKFTKGNTIVRLEKLWYLQKHHVARRCELAKRENSLAPLEIIIDQVRHAAQSAFSEAIPARFTSESELKQYVAEILLVDSKSYATPQKYIERNAYFFSYEPTRVPDSAAFYDKDQTITGEAVETFIQDLLSDFDFLQPYRETHFALPSSKTSTPAQDNQDSPKESRRISQVDQIAARIHAAVNHRIWETLLLSETSQGPPVTNLDHAPIPFTDQSVDVKQIALALCEGRFDSAEQLDVAAAGLVKAYKEWNKAVMKYLREKLSYGLPGPGVGDIMAILGYRETCRRLGIRNPQSRGWQ